MPTPPGSLDPTSASNQAGHSPGAGRAGSRDRGEQSHVDSDGVTRNEDDASALQDSNPESTRKGKKRKRVLTGKPHVLRTRSVRR